MPIRSHVLWGAGGVAVGILATSLFNVVRFGSVLNTNYLEPELHTPGVIRPLEYGLAIVLSPNGGVAVYWPAACAILALACFLPLALRQGSDLPQWPALVIVGVVVALTLGFAAWWDPFGSGYGPRLALPWVLPLVLLALAAYGPELGALMGALAVGLFFPHDSWRRPGACSPSSRSSSSSCSRTSGTSGSRTPPAASSRSRARPATHPGGEASTSGTSASRGGSGSTDARCLSTRSRGSRRPGVR